MMKFNISEVHRNLIMFLLFITWIRNNTNMIQARFSLIYLLLLLLLTDICLRKLMYITNAHAVNSHEKILLSPRGFLLFVP